jgi:hypothetical protein
VFVDGLWDNGVGVLFGIEEALDDNDEFGMITGDGFEGFFEVCCFEDENDGILLEGEKCFCILWIYYKRRGMEQIIEEKMRMKLNFI